MKDIRIAAVIFNSIVNQPQNNLARMARWVKRAQKQGAQLICFPELSATGYSTRPEIKDSAEPVPAAHGDALFHVAQPLSAGDHPVPGDRLFRRRADSGPPVSGAPRAPDHHPDPAMAVSLSHPDSRRHDHDPHLENQGGHPDQCLQRMRIAAP